MAMAFWDESARARLETMVRTSNGFEIAETHLLLRQLPPEWQRRYHLARIG